MKPVGLFVVIMGTCLGLGTISAPLAAQTVEERAGARAAADRGFEAFNKGNWAEAIDLFARAESVVHSPVHLLYLARTHSKLGQLVEAKDFYLRVTREQISPGAPPAMMQAQRSASQELAALEPRIPYVSIVVQGDAPPPDVQVYMDKNLIPPALVGVPYPVNPGSHTWQAAYHDRRSAESTLVLEEGAQETVVLSLKVDRNKQQQAATAPPLASNPADLASHPTDARQAAPEDEAPSSSKPLLYASIAGFGVGVAGLVTGIVFAVKKSNLEQQIDDTCCAPGENLPPNTPANRERLEDADSAGTWSGVGFAVAGVGLVAGGVLLGLHLSSGKSEQAQITPFVGYKTLGVSGRF